MTKFKPGDLVQQVKFKPGVSTTWWNSTWKNKIGKVIPQEVESNHIAVDFYPYESNERGHTLNNRIKTHTGWYFYPHDIELIEDKEFEELWV